MADNIPCPEKLVSFRDAGAKRTARAHGPNQAWNVTEVGYFALAVQAQLGRKLKRVAWS